MTEQATADKTQTALTTAADREREIEARRDAATVSPQLLLKDVIREVATLNGGTLQRVVVRVPLFPKHQYLIPGPRRQTKKGDNNSWVGLYDFGIKAEGYDQLNRVGGIRFHTPPTVHNRDGKEVPNPIHARDYLYHREVGIGYSEIGQQVVYVEDIEIDFRMSWEAERLRALRKLTKPKKAKGNQQDDGFDEFGPPEDAAPVQAQDDKPEEELILRDENGMPKQGPNGELLFRLPQADEVAAMERLITLRNYGGRMAKTIARRRILTTVHGRSLGTVEMPGYQRPALETKWVWVTGWRDNLTPDEAWEKAKQEQEQVFGAPIGQYEHGDVDEGEWREADDEAATVEAAKADAEVASAPETNVPEVHVDSDPPRPVTPEARAGVLAQAAAGVIPGVTRGMPGEKLAKAICGSRDSVGPNPCTDPPGHWPDPHHSKDGVWPADDIRPAPGAAG